MNIKKIFETAKDTNSRIQGLSPENRIQKDKRHLACTIRLDTSRTFQQFQGFGGALTESSGYVLSLIPAEKRKEAVDAYFSLDTGNGYVFARTHLNSSDFSLKNWACVEKQDDLLESFSMERTDKYITPLVKQALDCTGGNLNLLVSTWSPPAWMKDNADMNNGGKLLKKYYPLWAAYFVRFIDELKKRGIDTWAVSVQNEPAAKQTWDSCLYTAVEEGEFAVNHLGPALEKYVGNEGKKIKILVWDHNRDLLWERFSQSMSVPGADKYIDGAAFHWYSGDQYENVAKVAQAFPDKDLVFTEGCIEGGARPGAWFPGERYAHNIINDLNHGCTAWIDWNIVLDMSGGPNHVGNVCDAPILADTDKGDIYYQSSYYYIGHFSRFIKPKAQRVDFSVNSYMTPATVDGRMGNMAEFCAFKNTDGSLALVVMNRTEADLVYEISGSGFAALKCPPRGIQTLLFS
ncbi:MAG: glucosylceramidase [Treponema sp.]|jgi:glucosylceramidase|nr:glucosylceramidase [Treponema sp.]